MSDRSVMEWLRYQADVLRVWQAEGALTALERWERKYGLPAHKKPSAWVVTWTLVRDPRRIHRPGISDGTSTLTSWDGVLDYIERIVPRDATFTVKPA